ncbi:MAG: hypothetical protein ACLUQ6_11960 [Alistipes onderdonkii]
MRITPTIANPALTPASMSSGTRATDTDFELNDKVGLTITMTADGSAFVANKEMSFDGTGFQDRGLPSGTKMSTPPRRSSPIIPTRPKAAAPAEFSVKADQSGANYTASDPIVAVKTGVKLHAVVHADDLQAQNVADRHQRDQRIGFRHPGHRHHSGAVGTGVLDPATGDFTAKAGAEGIRRDRQYGPLPRKFTTRCWCRRTVCSSRLRSPRPMVRCVPQTLRHDRPQVG